MGDMKTPDFDDLLAAFDIPDMVDPKAAIESGHCDERDGQLKQPSGVTTNEDEAHNTSTGHDVGVSVIVKNLRNTDNREHGETVSERDFHSHSQPHSVDTCNRLHNGFLTGFPQYTKNGWKAPREEGLPVNNQPSTYNQFSPISSAEEFDEDDKIEVDEPMDNRVGQTFFRSSTKGKDQNPKSPISVDNVSKPRANKDQKPDQNNNNNNNNNNSVKIGDSKSNNFHQSSLPKEDLKSHSKECKEAEESSGLVNVSPTPQVKSKSSAKLSSCIAAIAALSAKKANGTELGVLDSPPTHKETNTANENPAAPERPQQHESALEFAKRLLTRPQDSPSSVTSEGSSKGSPSSSIDTTPVIPKVRIKTIKTSSGQIKRTVTRVLPEFDPDGLKKGENSTSVMATTTAIFSSPTRPPTRVVATTGGPSIEITKQMTIKPVATAFLPVSAVKTAGSQVINLKLANNTTIKATIIPAASMQSASSAILKAANVLQRKTVMVPASSLANAKLVPKTVHLGNLNLLPQTVQALTSSKQSQKQSHVKQQIILTGQASKKVSRVQVISSTQSSVVEAFNKVLSSINPVPVYVPNLSPPTSACISLPSRGYKCLECGDSFALEKSRTQHYERRSVRIEVTCNHCAKSLVFYNKCSLLSHARGHKDKGVVMQCSHLILKPIPLDQMIPTSLSSGSPNITGTTTISQAQAPKGQISGKGTVSGSQTAVISAPCSAPFVAAMPLDDDASKPCRHSLKCMECNEMFQDDSLLATHYQQAPESSGQKTCTICQMLLPNKCSFQSHQRIHQHKSPYICPECGASCRSVHFQSHVTKNCLHYTRRVGYRCHHCSVIFTDVATMKSHIQSAHCETFYKCALCPMAFKTAPGTHSHAHIQHPGVKAGEPKLIYKCSMCDTVFSLQSLLCAHFDQHVANHKVSVFKCPDCSLHYAQKQLMLDHIKAIHGTLKTTEGPPNLGINLPLSIKPTNSNNSTNTNGPSNNNNKDGGNVNRQDKGEKKPSRSPQKKSNSNSSAGLKSPPSSRYTCGDCSTLFSSREVFVAHMRHEHGKILKKHPCRQCDKSFSSSHSLCRHNRLKHKGLRKVYTCPHCPALSQPFTKRVLLDQHIQKMHGVKEPEGKTVRSENVKELPGKETTPSPKRKPEEDEGSPALNSKGSDSHPLKRLKVNIPKVHKCAVCGFPSEDIAAFRKHIPQHKSDGSSFQCQECGLCYTSHRSLSRHLFIDHRLKEPHGLARYNGRGRDDDEIQRENQLDVTDKSNDGKPNTKCKVCGKMFETEGNLKTHMRTHGMAFIKSKRLSAAEK
ncbi:zinc finger protein 532 [Hippoglossus stenolepis]|uniref:zinc finger protein 532 n=1 Tax=Hippoglossus stenolepis TaxID=195615 RepID=UPI00159C6470|nr:zinc finger protein 532 [Hippoglossus stenolepis]XP_034997336.1 zinc finger protein 532 [Hippoglossus stenolepis]XP_034997338.1 zinc finger protein 532 [Hippoglossus stenolepis]XP_034997339.1 zinc finger protein 532 [Hippoglossus stenolepis]XP_034997340.1 zinc finger protein 532 [Hippoglossus stenolepis]